MKMSRRLLSLAACTLVAFMALSVKVNSYAINGHTWGSNQVVYYVNPSNIYVSTSAATWSFQTAAAGWHDQTNANIQLVYGGTTNGSSLTNNGKNEIFFRNDSSSYLAETYWWYDGTGHLVDADMVLHENWAWFSGSGCSNGIYIEDVAIHEFGHVLGLAHSDVAGATMNASMPGYCDTTQLTLEADDISGIQSLYPPTNSAPTTPAAPSQLAVKNNNSSPTSSLALTWADNSNSESGYRVDRSTDGSSFSQVAQLGTNATSYMDSGLSASTVYYYRVKAYNNSGNSGDSNIASGQTQAAASTNTAPTVTIISPSSGSTYASGTMISFTGSATDTQDGILTNTINWTSNLDGPVGTGGSVSKSLSSGTHTITARVTDAGGLVGSKQLTVTVSAPSTPPPPPPPPPASTTGATLTARAYKTKGSQAVDLSWSGLTASSVDIYRDSSIISMSANDGAQTDSINKKGGGSYTYKVCASGTATCTNSVSVSF